MIKKFVFPLLSLFLIGSLLAKDKLPVFLNETTLSLYCKNMFYAADLDDQTTLFWGHQGIDHFPSYLEKKTVVSIIELSHSPNSKHKSAFTAILNDQTLFCWGNQKYGGVLPKELVEKKVTSVISTKGAFAALLDDGSVRAWGNEQHGGKTPTALLKKPLPGHRVISLASTSQAFLALLEDGTICAWGDPYHGGTSPCLTNVISIIANHFAFTALLSNGSVVSWCNSVANDYTTPNLKGDTVKTIVATDQMFSALLKSGKIISWGFKANQIISPSLKPGEQALSIAAHDNEFTAYLDSGRILLWNGYDRDSTSLQALAPIAKDSSPSILVSDTSFALTPDQNMAFSWKSIMDNDGTHGATTLLSSPEDLVDIVSIPGGFSTLSKRNKIFSLIWNSDFDSYLEQSEATPTLPLKRILTSLYAHFANYETKPFPSISPSDHLALIENPLSDQGQWEYLSQTGWLPLPFLPDPERPRGFILRGDTKIRFVPIVKLEPHYIPGLTLQRL